MTTIDPSHTPKLFSKELFLFLLLSALLLGPPPPEQGEQRPAQPPVDAEAERARERGRVLLHVRDRARAALKALEARGVFVRMPAVEPMDRCIRVSVGLPQERAAFREAFEAVLKEI